MTQPRFHSATFLIILFLVQFAHARPPANLWRTGQLSFWDGASTAGELTYNWSAEVVLLRMPTGQIRTYSANQVRQFVWFDPDQHKQRTFVSLSQNRSSRVLQSFYEVCLDGQLTVVRRLRPQRGWINRFFNHPLQAGDRPRLANDTDQFRYFVYQNGRLLAFDRFYPDIYVPSMAVYDRQLRQYVLRHNINDRTTVGRLVLVDHYNFLSRTNQEVILARRPGSGIAN